MKYLVLSSKERVFQIHAMHYHHALLQVAQMFQTADAKREFGIGIEKGYVEYRWLNPNENAIYPENFLLRLIDPRLLPEALSLNDFTS